MSYHDLKTMYLRLKGGYSEDPVTKLDKIVCRIYKRTKFQISALEFHQREQGPFFWWCTMFLVMCLFLDGTEELKSERDTLVEWAYDTLARAGLSEELIQKQKESAKTKSIKDVLGIEAGTWKVYQGSTFQNFWHHLVDSDDKRLVDSKELVKDVADEKARGKFLKIVREGKIGGLVGWLENEHVTCGIAMNPQTLNIFGE